MPLLLLLLIPEELSQLAVALGAPVADLLLPCVMLDSASGTVVGWSSVSLIVLPLGLIAPTGFGSRAGRAIERNTLEHLPIYEAISSIARGLAADRQRHFRTVLFGYGNDTAAIGFVVEEIDGERGACRNRGHRSQWPSTSRSRRAAAYAISTRCFAIVCRWPAAPQLPAQS